MGGVSSTDPAAAMRARLCVTSGGEQPCGATRTSPASAGLVGVPGRRSASHQVCEAGWSARPRYRVWKKTSARRAGSGQAGRRAKATVPFCEVVIVASVNGSSVRSIRRTS